MRDTEGPEGGVHGSLVQADARKGCVGPGGFAPNCVPIGYSMSAYVPKCGGKYAMSKQYVPRRVRGGRTRLTGAHGVTRASAAAELSLSCTTPVGTRCCCRGEPGGAQSVCGLFYVPRGPACHGQAMRQSSMR